MHPAGIAVLAIDYARSFALAAVAVLATAGPARGFAIVSLALIAAGVFAYVNWRVTRYAVVDGGLRLRRGLLSRREQLVPASRISALDTSRGVVQRVFGVVALQVQTAGGGGRAELALGALSPAEAERLRQALGHRAAAAATPAETAADAPPGAAADAHASGHAAPAETHDGASLDGQTPAFARPSGDAGPVFRAATQEPRDEGRLVFSLGVRELLIAGVTSPNIAVIGAALAAFAGPAQDLLTSSVSESVRSGAERAVQTAPIAVAFGLLVVAILGAVVGTVLTYFGLRVTRDDRRLRVRRGLLTERTDTVSLDRIHGLRVVEHPLRQLIGRVSVEAEVAGWATQDETVRTLIPFARRRDLPVLLPELVPGYAWPTEAFHGVPTRAVRRYVSVILVPSVVVAGGLSLAPLGVAGMLVAGVLVAGAAALGVVQAREAGWRRDGDLLALRSRWVSRTTVIAQVPRLQRREVSAHPLQARAGLASFAVRLSSRRFVRLRHLEVEVAERLRSELRPLPAAAGAREAP